MAPARAIVPPIVWTIVEPAKSWNGAAFQKGMAFSQPSGPQAQWPKIG